jgi:hypothetical protein
MKRHLLVPIVFAGVALASGVASANPQYWRQSGLLLEVSADPRDGTDFVQVDPTRADSLEIRALNDNVRLRGLTLHLSDGRAISQRIGLVQPGQPVLVDLPQSCGAITSVELDYGDPARRRFDRTPARLQIIPRGTQHAYEPRYPSTFTPSYSYTPSYPSQPVYQTPGYRPSSSYTVQPRYTTVQPRRARTSWTIQGSFRF